ncbi:MAG TPA: methyltransferase domain-containing protein [Novosphingobium sp.]|nr:methyltransferase domain-containing protein [Novosphingobium sp.]
MSVAPPPPSIFSATRRAATRRQMAQLQGGPDAPRYIMADMVEDVLERLAFLRHRPARALVMGDWTGGLAAELVRQGAAMSVDEPDAEQPYPVTGFDFIASLGTLDTVNDLPGALVHIRNALAPGGLAIASFMGAGSLPELRAAMLAADGERPAPRLHPMVDVRAGGQLLQRAGWADPVVDSRSLDVRFRDLDRLVADLRAQGLGNVLARAGPPLSRAALDTARAEFGIGTVERFEILTLNGWKR